MMDKILNIETLFSERGIIIDNPLKFAESTETISLEELGLKIKELDDQVNDYTNMIEFGSRLSSKIDTLEKICSNDPNYIHTDMNDRNNAAKCIKTMLDSLEVFSSFKSTEMNMFNQKQKFTDIKNEIRKLNDDQTLSADEKTEKALSLVAEKGTVGSLYKESINSYHQKQKELEDYLFTFNPTRFINDLSVGVQSSEILINKLNLSENTNAQIKELIKGINDDIEKYLNQKQLQTDSLNTFCDQYGIKKTSNHPFIKFTNPNIEQTLPDDKIEESSTEQTPIENVETLDLNIKSNDEFITSNNVDMKPLEEEPEHVTDEFEKIEGQPIDTSYRPNPVDKVLDIKSLPENSDYYPSALVLALMPMIDSIPVDSVEASSWALMAYLKTANLGIIDKIKEWGTDNGFTGKYQRRIDEFKTKALDSENQEQLEQSAVILKNLIDDEEMEYANPSKPTMANLTSISV
jgi:DNA-binding ferritin-like protein (Dps family)